MGIGKKRKCVIREC